MHFSYNSTTHNKARVNSQHSRETEKHVRTPRRATHNWNILKSIKWSVFNLLEFPEPRGRILIFHRPKALNCTRKHMTGCNACSDTFPDSSNYDVGSTGHDSNPKTSKYEPQDLSSTPRLSLQIFKKPRVYLVTFNLNLWVWATTSNSKQDIRGWFVWNHSEG